MKRPIVVKLGGSAITDKSRICVPRMDKIHQAAGEIASYHEPLILLHGGGSFAHPFVTKKLLANGFRGKSQLQRVSEVELNLDQLTRIIGVSLLLRGRPFIPLKPMSLMTLQDGKIYRHFLRPITEALRLGFIPVLHGDLVMDEKKGVGVVSADRIASLIGQENLSARVLFGCDVDGVYSDKSYRKTIREIDKSHAASVMKSLGRSNSDVTGGMQGKVREAIVLAKHGIESHIFNLNTPNNLTRLLAGDTAIGTRFVPWK